MLAVIEEAERAGDRADTILVDGAGVLHPRRAGIAAMLGVVSGYPTIGIAKSHLCGSYDATQLAREHRAPVTWAGEVAGLAMLTRRSSPKPVYISPGNRHSVGSAVVVVRDLISSGYLPAPVAAADRISRQVAREEKVHAGK
jgi:deoxyribonuclease V